jgi:UDP-N-acetylmuramyl pentapeptide phosphotransferase/UDP-N-acetylglucosamine-1-phosphate transferase
VHCVAALIILVPIVSTAASRELGAFGAVRSLLATAVVFGCFWLALVWSINLHNFMDGIDGLLAWQGVFVFVALAALMKMAAADADAWHLCVLAAAVAGFIPFNFPRARVFMGDVGSGVLGLLIGIAVLRQIGVREIAMPSGVIACSAFVVDATCNLVSRMLRGRRWYSAHREHLYQWLARSGMSHARVVAWYMGWNLLLVVPVLYWINRGRAGGIDVAPSAGSQLVTAAAVYTLGIALWIFGKRWCLLKVKSQRRHAAA